MFINIHKVINFDNNLKTTFTDGVEQSCLCINTDNICSVTSEESTSEENGRTIIRVEFSVSMVNGDHHNIIITGYSEDVRERMSRILNLVNVQTF